jgi:hypothetical protein
LKKPVSKLCRFETAVQKSIIKSNKHQAVYVDLDRDFAKKSFSFISSS